MICLFLEKKTVTNPNIRYEIISDEILQLGPFMPIPYPNKGTEFVKAKVSNDL
jgi:hypothetical protein